MTEERPLIVYDASNAILGRLASAVAKQALLGKRVIVVNCKEAVVSGKRSNILSEYRTARQRGGSSMNGPHFPKHPFRLVKRTVRGMLYFRHGRGKDAFKRVLCYDSVPAEYESLKIPFTHRKLNVRVVRLSEISQNL